MKEKFHEYEKMHAVEGSLWWYKILHTLILDYTNSLFKNNKEIEILDAGCGTGGLMKRLIQEGYHNVQGFDISEHAIAFTRERGLNVHQMDLMAFSDQALGQTFDLIISNDTLNYFGNEQEQRQVLNNFYSNLRPGGILIMNLAAFNAFKGIHDMAVGIKLRFTLKSFTALLQGMGFELHSKRFWPFFLSPIIYWVRRKQQHRIASGDYEVTSDIDLPSQPVNAALHGLTRLELLFSKSYPIGSSLMVVLKKTG